MNKKFVFIFLLFFLFPFYVNAISVNNISISGDDTVYTKKSIVLKTTIGFKDFDNTGIAVVSYRLSFNKYAFEIAKIDTNGVWDSKLYQDSDDKYYIVSTINAGTSNRCSDGLLYCGNYEASITFYAKDTDTIKSDEIKIDAVELGLLKTDYDAEKLSASDVMLYQDSKNTSKVIKIEKSGAVTGFVYKPIEVNNSKPKINNETVNIKKNNSTEYIKSDNNHIEKLEIEGYKIKFRTSVNDYNLTVKEGVNSLKITVSLISSKAKYKIIGADNLEENNNEVKIEVTAENGDKNVYNIKVEHEKEVVLPVRKEKKEQEGIDKKYYIIAGSIVGGIVLIILIIKLILWISEHKMRKQLDKL